MSAYPVTPGTSTVNIRSVLEYVPYFRSKLFFVHVSKVIWESNELVDALLDLKVLEEIGVRLVLIAEGTSAESLYVNTMNCEMRSALVGEPLTKGESAFQILRKILDRGQMPVVASGVEGDSFPAHVVRAAVELRASKYIALMDGRLVPMRNQAPVHAIRESDVREDDSDISYANILNEAARVCRMGVPRVHLLDGTRRGVLVDELFSEEGVGTMVHADTYREIRPLREMDIPELLSMIGRSVQKADLIERTYEDVSQRLSEYYVLTLDDTIVGSVAVHLYPADKAAEVACLYIKNRHEGLGYGRALVAFAETRARTAGMENVFAVSKSAVEFFRDRMHYAEWPRELLPARRLHDLESSGRNSGVFGHSLLTS